jgi:hypothetical protein
VQQRIGKVSREMWNCVRLTEVGVCNVNLPHVWESAERKAGV